MATPRILPGRMPDDLRELTADVAGLEAGALARLAEALRRCLSARTSTEDRAAVLELLAAWPHAWPSAPNGSPRYGVERLGLAYEVATGEQLVKGGLVARLINRKLEG